MQTLIISSSLSPNSRSFVLCKEVYRSLKERKVQCELIDARNMELVPFHSEPTESMKNLTDKVANVDNIIFGMGVHCYSINDGLKIILDACFGEAKNKFFGILCAAGGQRSYLSTQHLTQICMNEWRMIQLPRIVYVTGGDFDNDCNIQNDEVIVRINKFVDESIIIGNKLIN